LLNIGKWGEEGDDKWGRTSVIEERRCKKIYVHIPLQLGSSGLHTYFIAFFVETKNCNAKFLNSWIAVVFFQSWKNVMA
jgi:hypothetical protein